jgi:hypothetical protein
MVGVPGAGYAIESGSMRLNNQVGARIRNNILQMRLLIG